MLSLGDNRRGRARGTVSVSEPPYGFFIAGSSLKDMNGVRDVLVDFVFPQCACAFVCLFVCVCVFVCVHMFVCVLTCR
jgi:hypothetical protein